MWGINFLAVIVAVVAVFVVSTVWYIAFDAQRTRLLGPKSAPAGEPKRPPVGKIVLELLRSLVLAVVIAGLAAAIPVTGFGSALVLGLVLWIGFPLILLTGSIIWDGVPWKLAAIHGGDWLLKLVVIAVLVGVWR